MSEKVLLKDAELYRRIEEVVHYIWDPLAYLGFLRPEMNTIVI